MLARPDMMSCAMWPQFDLIDEDERALAMGAFEHEALREGCVTCHNPHGSVNRGMLVQRDANLCLRCHAQVQTGADRVFIGKMDHTGLLRNSTCWSAGCHSAVHGSNFSPRLLY